MTTELETLTTGGAAVDPMRPVAGDTDSQLDFDDPAQVQESATKAATTKRGRQSKAEKDAGPGKGKAVKEKSAPAKEAKDVEPRNNGRRQPPRRVPSRDNRSQRRQQREASDIADPDGSESPDAAYERVAAKYEGRGRRDDRGDRGGRSDREEARRGREDRNRDRQRRRSGREPVGGFESLRDRGDDYADLEDDNVDDRGRKLDNRGRRIIHDDQDDERGDRRDTRRRREETDEFDDRRDRRSRRDERDEIDDEDDRGDRRESREDRDDRRADARRRRDERMYRDDDDEYGLSGSLVREAMDIHGLDRDEIFEDFEDDEALERHLLKLDRKAHKEGRIDPNEQRQPTGDADNDADSEKPGQGAGRKPATPPTGKKGAGQSDRNEQDDEQDGQRRIKPFAFEFKDDPELQEAYSKFNEPTKKVLSRMTSHLEGEVERLTAEKADLGNKVDFLLEQHRNVNLQRYVDRMDSFFDEIKDDYGDIFGEGPMEDLDPESDEAKSRAEFNKELQTLLRGYKKNQYGDREFRTFQHKALRLFAKSFDRLQQNIRRDTTKKVDRRRRMTVNRPSNRTRQRENEETPEERAGRRADEFYADRGYRVDDRYGDDDWNDGV